MEEFNGYKISTIFQAPQLTGFTIFNMQSLPSAEQYVMRRQMQMISDSKFLHWNSIPFPPRTMKSAPTKVCILFLLNDNKFGLVWFGLILDTSKMYNISEVNISFSLDMWSLQVSQSSHVLCWTCAKVWKRFNKSFVFTSDRARVESVLNPSRNFDDKCEFVHWPT